MSDRVCLIRLAIVAGLLAVSATTITETLAADTQEKLAPRPTYASPQAVFEAYRAAMDRGDWRTIYYCQTRKANDELLFETYFSTQTSGSPKIAAVLKKHDPDGDLMKLAMLEYEKRYQAKHGVDIGKIREERARKYEAALAEYYKTHACADPAPGHAGEAMPVPPIDESKLGPPLPPDDEELSRGVLAAAIKDQAGFVADINNITMARPDAREKISALTTLKLQANRATGTAVVTTYSEMISTTADGKESHKRIRHDSPEEFKFRKSVDGWLIGN